MATGPTLHPPEIQATLNELVEELRRAAGNNLAGVALYGGLAKGRYTPGISDINILVVLRDAGLPALEAVAPALTGARRRNRVSALVATHADLREASRLFPVKMADLKASHRVLHGDVGLQGLEIDRQALRLRALQELKNTALRLRQRAVERGADPTVLWGGLVQSLPKLTVTLETVLSLRGVAVPSERAGVLRAAGESLGLAEAVAPFLTVHRHEPRPDDASVRRLFGDYLKLVDALSDRIGRELQG
jgi:predicted nucleotidyltransferase